MRRNNVKIFVGIFVFGLIGFSHVYLRMQCVDEDYALNDLRGKIKKASLLNKELKADKAKLLSVKNLRSYAKRYKLKVPEREQIIVIKDNAKTTGQSKSHTSI